jgi:hypothetical protein
MTITIPFLSKAFEYINIPDISTTDPCQTSSCDSSQIKVYNYSNKTCPSSNTPYYCGTINDDEPYDSVENSATFLRFDGSCDENTCFFTNSLFENSNPQKLSWHDSKITLRHCCYATKDDPFCYHNLEWGNSCNIGYSYKEEDGSFITFNDQVFLPWVTQGTWSGYQPPGYCASESWITYNDDSRWCGPAIDSSSNIPNWDTGIYAGGTGTNHNTSTPSHMCDTLYGRKTIDNAYVLGQQDNTGRYYGNVICGPIDTSLECINPPCDAAKTVCSSNDPSAAPNVGCPSKGPNGHYTFKDQCVLGTDSETATSINYTDILGKNINPANGDYNAKQDWNH